MAEIPFWVHDRPKWVSGITATTTCREILISLAVSIQEDVKKLILTEKWHDVERPLNNDSKILPIWNSWGEERKHVRIVVKRVKNHHKKHKWKRRGSISSMASVDEMHPKALDVNSEVKSLKKSHSGQITGDSPRARFFVWLLINFFVKIFFVQ